MFDDKKRNISRLQYISDIHKNLHTRKKAIQPYFRTREETIEIVFSNLLPHYSNLSWNQKSVDTNKWMGEEIDADSLWETSWEIELRESEGLGATHDIIPFVPIVSLQAALWTSGCKCDSWAKMVLYSIIKSGQVFLLFLKISQCRLLLAWSLEW